MKISTSYLKTKIVEWIQKKDIRDTVEPDIGRAAFQGLLKTKNWSRENKSKLTEDNPTYSFEVFVDQEGGKNVFAFDVGGECDQSLVDFYSDESNKALREKITVRCFTVSEAFDNAAHAKTSSDYRIEILTDHNDENIIGWSMTVD